MKVIGLILFIGALCLTAVSGNAADWVFAQMQSCQVACQSVGKNPVISGTYTLNGNPFYVCRSNVVSPYRQEGEGGRAGYNLQPHWSNVCVAGEDGREKKYSRYDCLCE